MGERVAHPHRWGTYIGTRHLGTPRGVVADLIRHHPHSATPTLHTGTSDHRDVVTYSRPLSLKHRQAGFFLPREDPIWEARLR